MDLTNPSSTSFSIALQVSNGGTLSYSTVPSGFLGKLFSPNEGEGLNIEHNWLELVINSKMDMALTDKTVTCSSKTHPLNYSWPDPGS